MLATSEIDPDRPSSDWRKIDADRQHTRRSHPLPGPWVALSPGSRRDLSAVLPLAEQVAEAGYRILLHDRRNCGASDVVTEGDESEYEIWADDLYALLSQLDALPAYVGGSSSGCRLSLLFALRHPEAVRALLLWRVTGGPFAAQRLGHNYYVAWVRTRVGCCRTASFIS
jgi:pimeloyl-ACP methyl ester carboxylesterase